MNTYSGTAGGLPGTIGQRIAHDVDVRVEPMLESRNRLTVAFRPILAIPHLLLVGGPLAFIGTLGWHSGNGPRMDWGLGTGVLGAVAMVVALIAWFSVVFTGSEPDGLWKLAAFYLRWRVRAVAYFTLLRDEYPPFDDTEYPACLVIEPPTGPRNRLTVAFRLFLALPQILAVALMSVLWAATTLFAWVSILVTGEFPAGLHRFGVGMLRWSTRVEAYLLLLRDEYPPFALE